MQLVVPERHMEVAGEPRLSQLQPAMELLQAGEQGDAEGGGVWCGGLRGLDNLFLDDLLPILPFISQGKI